MISFTEIGYLGRLGNQIFQFASTLGISRKLGLNPIFPEENSYNTKETGPIDLNTGKRLRTKLEIRECFDLSDDFFLPLKDIKPTLVYQETDFTYNKSVEYLTDGTDLYGYFQSEKYFIESKKELISCLKFLPIHYKNTEKFFASNNLGNITNPKVSIHVRRGDYINLADYHPPCSLNYYKSAIQKFENIDSVFLVFSDDIIWAKDNLKIPNTFFVELGDPYAELCIMSQCDHNIIANSSFSWWGSYLNKNPNKIVVAPSKWFGKAVNKDTKDIYCNDWIIV
jgi:hypothetical protein